MTSLTATNARKIFLKYNIKTGKSVLMSSSWKYLGICSLNLVLKRTSAVYFRSADKGELVDFETMFGELPIKQAQKDIEKLPIKLNNKLKDICSYA